MEFSRCADWKKDCGSGEENDLERLFGKENKADYLFIEGLDEAPYDIKKTVEQLNELLVKNCRNQAGHYRTVIVSMRVPVWEAFEEEIGKGARVGGVYDRIPYYVEFDLFDENDTQTREILKEESSRLRKHANPKREKLKGLPKLLNTIRLARRIFWKHVRWAKKVESNVTPPSRPRKASRQLTKLLWRERENSLWCIPFYAANADALLEKDFARGNHAERMAAIVRQRFKGEANKIYDDTEEWEQLQQKVEPYILAIAQRMFEQNTLAIETKDLSADNLHNEAENYPKAAPDKDLFNHITMFLRSRGERTPFDHLTLREYFVVQSVVGRWKKENLGAVKTVNDLDNYLKEDALLNEARASRRAELRNYFLDKYELTLGRKTIKKSEFIDGEWTNLYLNFGKLDWIVLDIDKENDRALLLSKDIVEERAYNNEKNEDTTWEECSLQTYLNGEFLESLGHDKKWVLRTHNENPDNTWGRLKGEQLNTPGGNTTEDYIFLLSVPEVLKYFPGLKLNKDEDGDEWHYEFDERLLAKFNGDKATWWLRSPGSSNYKAVFVLDSGHCVTLGDSVVNPYVGVRPALWLNLKSESS
ncbi:MAG: DUF6273 domain-containing protein [Oscillospiraceae bacterium]|nr:DUF6273 domain-containing protein [Oscillospiraceae bacterium]